jgi:hypothetical protein
LDVFLGLVRDDGRRVGESIVPDQLADARVVLDPESSTPYSWLGRARGYSKTDDLAGMALAVLLVQAPRRARCYGFAADREQAQLLADSFGGFVERSAEVRGAFDVETWKVTARHNGASLSVMASDSASTWGLRPFFAVFDEVANLEATGRPRRVWDAVVSAMGKVPGSRLVAITTAGDPSSWQWKRREHARVDPAWHFHELEGPPPWMPEDRLEEQRRQLLPSLFERLFANVWTAPEGRLATVDDVLACVGHDGDLACDARFRYVCSLDVGLVNDATVAVVAHTEGRPEGLTVVVDRVARWQGSRASPVSLSAVEAWVREACRGYRCRLVYDPFQAAHLTQRLKAGGVTVEAFTFSAASVGKLAATLYGLIRHRRLDLPSDDALVTEMSTVKLRETSPGVVRLDHAAGEHDDQVIAVAMCAQALVGRPVHRGAGVAGRGLARPTSPGTPAREPMPVGSELRTYDPWRSRR